MIPIHAATIDAISAVIRRHYLRPISLAETPGDPDRWEVWVNGHRAKTEVVLSEGRYTFRDAPIRKVPQWDREIENETH